MSDKNNDYNFKRRSFPVITGLLLLNLGVMLFCCFRHHNILTDIRNEIDSIPNGFNPPGCIEDNRYREGTEGGGIEISPSEAAALIRNFASGNYKPKPMYSTFLSKRAIDSLFTDCRATGLGIYLGYDTRDTSIKVITIAENNPAYLINTDANSKIFMSQKYCPEECGHCRFSPDNNFSGQ